MSERQHTPTKHSVTVGGSSAGHFLQCPAHYKLVKKMPKGPESSYAAEGTGLHECIGHCLVEGLMAGRETDDLVGQEFYGITITSEHISDCIDPALRQFDKIYIDLEKDGEVIFKLEQQVQFPGIPDSFGTLDVIMSSPKRVVILDWKFGGGVAVSATDNPQMKFYAVAAAETHPGMFFDSPSEYEKAVDVVIVQPRINTDHPERWSTSLKELSEFKYDLVNAYEMAINPDPDYHRGEHCRWCAAQPICPLYKDVAQNLANLVATGQSGAEPGSEAFNQNDLAEWMVTADIVTTWAKAVGELVMSEANAGRPPAGKKLVRKLANTSYVATDPIKIDQMLARFGLDVKVRRKPWQNISPTQADKILKKDGKALRKGATQRLPGNAVLVDLSDKRDAIVTDAEKAKQVGEALDALHQKAVVQQP